MEIDKQNIPQHVAIIPDGNRRWAKDKGLEPWEGHEVGAQNMEKITRLALKMGIKSLSFWGSSKNNLEKRPTREKMALLDIYERYFKKIIDSPEVHDNQARVRIIGDWKGSLPSSLVKIFEDGMQKTEKYGKHQLNFFLAYNGDEEMVEAVRNIVKKNYKPEEISGAIIKENLLTKDLPPVDLLIRTGGDPHLSVGFMMWDIADAQLLFPEIYFPDFQADEFEGALKKYQERERRRGK